jgi:hypothetical protein
MTIQVSAKSGANVSEAFQLIIRQSLDAPAKLLSASAAAALSSGKAAVDSNILDSSNGGSSKSADGTNAKVIVAGANSLVCYRSLH